MAERTEEILFKFEVKDNPLLLAEMQRALDFEPPQVETGSVVTISYRFFIEYFGDIVERFRYLIDLARRGVVISANMENTRDGEILIQKVFEIYRDLLLKVRHDATATLPPAESPG